MTRGFFKKSSVFAETNLCFFIVEKAKQMFFFKTVNVSVRVQ